MADIEIRFHKDMLVLSAPMHEALQRQGVDPDDLEFVGLLEPETLHGLYRLDAIAGTQCMVTNTEAVCEARLAHKCLESRQEELAIAGLQAVKHANPQHIICEIGACGLPLDFTSEQSKKYVRKQYADAVKAFHDDTVDAFMFTGICSVHDAECALMGAREVTNRPLFVVFDIDERGCLIGRDDYIEDVVQALGDLADVYGFASGAQPEVLCDVAKKLACVTNAPLLVQINVCVVDKPTRRRASLGAKIPGNPYPVADSLVDAAVSLRACGVQFLRAGGEATCAYTGALVVATLGHDCIR